MPVSAKVWGRLSLPQIGEIRWLFAIAALVPHDLARSLCGECDTSTEILSDAEMGSIWAASTHPAFEFGTHCGCEHPRSGDLEKLARIVVDSH
ncbi:hypothetical protein WBP07_21255 (plasmid) [Novosphingobium sp. BL-8A]|uniref:hypothetical protein n=1 Tax=Novosphingobium sp. BL-8A TaxID=3127639 RepID=UPI0037581D92